MVLALIPSVVGVLITALLAAVAVRSGSFTVPGGAVAALFGSIIVVSVGFPFFALLVLFVVGSVLATRYGFEEKLRAKLHEGTHGERGVSNVLAHIVIPTALAIGALVVPRQLPVQSVAILFTAALAFGAADTFASEFGVLSGKARSILSFKPVTAGTNGGVSGIGEMWAAVGALTTGIVAILLFTIFHAPVVDFALLVGGGSAAGFLGCQIDSVLGETLENRGYLSKGGTNFLSMLASVGLAAAFLVALRLPV